MWPALILVFLVVHLRMGSIRLFLPTNRRTVSSRFLPILRGIGFLPTHCFPAGYCWGANLSSFALFGCLLSNYYTGFCRPLPTMSIFVSFFPGFSPLLVAGCGVTLFARFVPYFSHVFWEKSFSARMFCFIRPFVDISTIVDFLFDGVCVFFDLG